MKNFQVGKLTLEPRDLAILKCLQSDPEVGNQRTCPASGVVDPLVFEADINALLAK